MYCIRYVVTLCSCVLFFLFSSVFVFSLFCTTRLVNKVMCIRDLLKEVVTSRIGCNIGGLFINILAYADDIAL